MRSPAEMGTIQIDITNACTLRCSNCTRFCGNHQKPFFMSYEQFTKAVDSLDGFNGVIGVMGGEPTLHPNFARFVRYLQGRFGPRKGENRLLYPQVDFIREIRRRECESCVIRVRPDGSRYIKSHGPGLWSNMGKSYRNHYELIQDTFHVQYLNDHLNASYHQPGLFARKDLGIPDEEWIPMRDRCWIQNEWSATITPKGAFFCEIAGALDILFDGPGGWPVEPGWWRRTPEEFGDQLHWCEYCGFALDTFVRNAEEETDDVSPTLYRMLQKTGSPKLAQGRVNPVKIENGVISEESKAERKHFTSYDRYIEHYEDRLNRTDSVLYQCEWAEARIHDGGDFGTALAAALRGEADWLLLLRDDGADTAALKNLIGRAVFHPGCLILGEGWAFLCKKALSLQKYGPETLSALRGFGDLLDLWDPDKVITLTDLEEKRKLKKRSIEAGKRYAVWGTGLYGDFLAEAVPGSGGKLVFAVDKSPERQGCELRGVPIYAPGYLAEHPADFDLLLVGHMTAFDEIRREAEALGVPEDKIRLPYEL